MILYKDFLIENEGYKYYFNTEEVLNVILENPQSDHRFYMQHAAEVYVKDNGRCIKHRYVNAEVANTIMRRAGHIE